MRDKLQREHVTRCSLPAACLTTPLGDKLQEELHRVTVALRTSIPVAKPTQLTNYHLPFEFCIMIPPLSFVHLQFTQNEEKCSEAKTVKMLMKIRPDS